MDTSATHLQRHRWPATALLVLTCLFGRSSVRADTILALSANDSSSIGIQRYNVDGTVLSDFATGVSGFQSLDFDATSGTLYGLWGSGRLAAFNTSGDLIGDAVLSGISLSSDSGADIAVHDGIVALNVNDGLSVGIKRFQVDGTVLSDFATGVPGFQSLDFDATSGTLYGLWGSGRLAAFNTSGDLIGDAVLSGISLSSDSGADIAVHDGIVALNENDTSSIGIRRYATDGTVLSNFDTFAPRFQSLDFDATTGTLYGLWGSGRLAAFNTSGDLIGDAVLSGISLSADSGADIAVHSMSTAAVPEPSTFGLLAIGGIAVGIRTRRRRSTQAAPDASQTSRRKC